MIRRDGRQLKVYWRISLRDSYPSLLDGCVFERDSDMSLRDRHRSRRYSHPFHLYSNQSLRDSDRCERYCLTSER